MTIHKSPLFWIILIVGLASLGLNVLLWQGNSSPATAAAEDQELYVCPMHPQVVQDHPGDCPICGMKLVKKQASASSDTYTDSLAGTVNLSPSQEVLAAVATAPVREATIQPSFTVPATVAAVEGNQAKVTARAMGQIKKLHVDYTGAAVKKGQPLYDFYSPDLAAALREATLAGQARSPKLQESLGEAARGKLLSLGLDEAQIRRLTAQEEIPETITFTSPLSGVVMDKMAVEGDWIMPGMALFDILDLSEVWVEGVLYENQVGRVQVGDSMEVRVDAYPTEALQGKVSWKAPMLDMMTRTLPFRVTLSNPEGKLKPGMYAEMRLSEAQPFTALAVPASAVLRTGERQVVWVKVGEGRYRPAEVRVGAQVDGQYPVLEGLNAGEEIVVQGGYLIDSDSQLRTMGGSGHQHGAPAEGQAPPEEHRGQEMQSSPGPLAPPPEGHEGHAPSPEPGHSSHSAEPGKSKSGQVETAEALYTCPMHPEFVTDDPDARCPECGMKLEKKEK
ncbi:MAG: efflux RND transporter periplasmic adaptor subunit [Candidatus Zixiibacteriota bacterium]|nr:MAG: efflux RND transporter periplasmic adaptor subunit [candidate division Zixibacteria bacterium]